MIWKLKHGLYGLKDGARQFFISVKEELLKLGIKQCLLDPAIFYLHKDGKLEGISVVTLMTFCTKVVGILKP